MSSLEVILHPGTLGATQMVEVGFILIGGGIAVARLFFALQEKIAQGKALEQKNSLTAPPVLPRRPAMKVMKKVAKPSVLPPKNISPPLPVTSPPVTGEPLKPLTVLPPAKTKQVHPWFVGRDALRRAMVTREVLGRPAALRPPRF
jgi:hypothetical protein